MGLNRRQALVGAAALAALGAPKRSRAKILNADTPISKIAFGSCAKQWEPQPIWTAIAATQPDLFLFLGDAIYGDWDGADVFTPTEETLRRDWSRLDAIPEFAAFRETTPILATWDNHDYGKHDGGAEFVLSDVSKTAFLDFFGEPKESERRRRPGIYDAVTVGPDNRRVQIILLDCRTFKGPYVKDERSKEEKADLGIRGQYLPNNDPGATLLGAAQWAWLEEQLLEPAELRLICSGTQIVADEKAMEEWGNFPHERRRLFDLIKRTRANGVILLSGNVHFAEVSATNEGSYRLIDFTASGMTHTNPDYAELRNGWRIAGPLTGLNFGLIEIDWSQSGEGIIRLSGVRDVGDVAFSVELSLSGLRA